MYHVWFNIRAFFKNVSEFNYNLYFEYYSFDKQIMEDERPICPS